ncbi:MAG: methyl-accepting chemotaxis protein [Anaeromyxobacter sp.]
MRLFLALLRNTAFPVGLALAIAVFAVESSFNLRPEQMNVLRTAAVLGFLAQLGLAAVACWALLRPIEAALDDLEGIDERTARLAAVGCHALALRVALLLFVSGLVVVLATGAALVTYAELGLDTALAGGAVGLAAALLQGLLAYAFCSATMTQVVVPLAERVEVVVRGTVREKILALGFGIATVVLLLCSAPSYVRYRADVERMYTFTAERAVEGALLAPAKTPEERVMVLSRASYSPAVLLNENGAVVARSGVSAMYLAASGAAEPGTVRVANGWLITRLTPEGLLARVLLSEGPLSDRRPTFWKQLGWLALMVYATTALLVWFAARAITLPFRPLNRAAGLIAAGDLTVAPPTLSRDEIGRLASDFRRMAHGLQGLVRDVQSASEGVSVGAREAGAIGEQVKRGALDQHAGVRSVQAAVEAMDGSVGQVSKGLGGLSEYVAATSRAVGEMAEAFDEVQRKGAEMERAMAAALGEVETLGGAGREAEGRLADLESLAGRAGGSLAEVKASVSGLERAAGETETTAAAVADLSDRAGLVMEETVHGIEALRTAVGDAHTRIAALGRRSDDIDQVVDFISEVAGRTNLLSLNASIIASQAGEHGKAFAVVADQNPRPGLADRPLHKVHRRHHPRRPRGRGGHRRPHRPRRRALHQGRAAGAQLAAGAGRDPPLHRARPPDRRRHPRRRRGARAVLPRGLGAGRVGGRGLARRRRRGPAGGPLGDRRPLGVARRDRHRRPRGPRAGGAVRPGAPPAREPLAAGEDDQRDHPRRGEPQRRHAAGARGAAEPLRHRRRARERRGWAGRRGQSDGAAGAGALRAGAPVQGVAGRLRWRRGVALRSR